MRRAGEEGTAGGPCPHETRACMSVCARMGTCERLLPQQALRLAAQLLDELPGQVARRVDGLPLADAILHEAQLQHLRLLARPPRRGRKVPAAGVARACGG